MSPIAHLPSLDHSAFLRGMVELFREEARLLPPNTTISFEAACLAADYREAEACFARWLALEARTDPSPLLERLPAPVARRAGLLPDPEAINALWVAESRGLYDSAP